jgi:hypothetical protein
MEENSHESKYLRNLFTFLFIYSLEARGSVFQIAYLVETLGYKPEGRGFHSR